MGKEIIREKLRESYRERFKRKRHKLEIMADILQVLEKCGGAKKTEIVYKANLNAERAKEYIDFLLNKGLIRYNGSLYHITEKGRGFLQRFNELINYLK